MTAVADIYAKEYQTLEGKEDVLFFGLLPDGTPNPEPIEGVKAIQGVLFLNPEPFLTGNVVALQPGDETWFLFADTMQGLLPVFGTYFTRSNGEDWQIKSYDTDRITHRCVCSRRAEGKQ